MVAAMIGRIMIASTTPEVKSPSPAPVAPLKKLRTGTSGRWLEMKGEMWWARNGPRVSAPHSP